MKITRSLNGRPVAREQLRDQVIPAKAIGPILARAGRRIDGR